MRGLLSLFLISGCFAAGDPKFGQLPIYFEAVATSPDHFEAHGLRYGVRIEPGKASVRLGRAAHRAEVTIEYLHCSPRPTLHAEQPMPARASEFIGNDRSRWRTNIPTYARVVEESLYPGVKLNYYGSATGLEYDFLVAPHANPASIRMRVGGIETLSLSPEGDLVMHTRAGDLVQHRPHIYQDIAGGRKNIDGSFVIAANHQVSFRIGPYNRNLPLTIDPQISFSSFLGSFDDDEGLSIAVDNSGNVYVAGYTTSNNFGGDADVMIASINPSGTSLNYIAQASGTFGIGGSADDVANGVAVDGYGSVVLVGSTSSADFPISQNAFQANPGGGNQDAFVMRLDPTGQNLVYSTFLGGSGDDEAWSVKIDALGNAYVTGDSTSRDFPVSNGAFQATNAGAADGFIAKLDNSGNRIWATYFGGNSDENSLSIAIDASGNSYVTGFTHSGNFPVANAYQPTNRGGTDAFVLKMNPTGTQLVYSTFLGGSGDDQANSIALDGALNAYVAGITTSAGFPVTNGSFQTTYQGGASDMFVSKLSPDGHSLIYSTFLGSHGTDNAWGIAVDTAGNAYIAGETDSDQFPVAGGPQQSSRRAGLDGTITQLNPNGTGLVYSSFFGGSGDDSVQAIALDAAGSVYLTGFTSSGNLPLAGGPFQATPGGGPFDAFVVKYSFPAIAPSVLANGVVNAGGFTIGAAVAPGSTIAIFGNNFASAAVNARSVPLSTTLAPVSVSINDVPAPLFFVSPTQINAQVPFEVQPGPATLVINGLGGTSNAASFTVSQAAPGILLNGTQALAQNADGNLNGPANPAPAGSTITVYLTGIGPVDNPVATGAAASSMPLSAATLPVTVTINNVRATTSFVGLVPGSVGLAQANIVIPPGISGNVPLQVSIGDMPSNMPTISVSP